MNKNKILIPIIVFTVIIIILIIMLNPNHRYNKISISESKWNNIQESRIENENLVLEDIRFNDYKLIIDKKNNTLYYSLVSDSKNKYNPNVEYKTVNRNVKLVIFTDEITEEKIKSNYQFQLMIYNEKEYHIYNLKCTDLPILNISYNKDEETKPKKIPMKMYLFDNLSNIPNKITMSSGRVKIDGENYIFSLHMLTPGKNKRDNKISILNMKPSSEYVLKKINNTSDNLQTQEININTEKHRVELFLNNKYKGVYFLEYIEENQKNDNNQLQNEH